MTCTKPRKSAIIAALLVGLAAIPAHAVPASAFMPLATVSVVDISCGSGLVRTDLTPTSFDASASKSSAILSGATSALDRIRQQQAGLADAPEIPVAVASPTPLERATTCPVTSFVATSQVKRSAASPVSGALAEQQFAIATSSDDFLATRRIAIRKTPFDRQWQRVAHARLSVGQVRAAMGSRPAGGVATLSKVNIWVNTQVRPVSDRTARRVADHWASAGQTLSRRSGDCEDFAILKYQMLAALGISRNDMYLTLARDLVRNADHAVLIVRHQGRFYMLDNATNELLDASKAHDYRATMSFTDGRAFLHGVRNPA